MLGLGQGGMADVLLAVGRGPGGFNKLVVLKTMRKELVADEELRQMFLAEARLSARLNHANVVQIYDVVDTALPCIVMEYLEGQSMSALLRAAGDRFTLPLQLRVISDALAGLHYSHELKDYDGSALNIVHRDVSPQNVFLTYEGQTKVLDFGIAKATGDKSSTRSGIIKGKVTYMPREQLTNGETDRRADVYAIGCMLWQTLAGKKLWANVPDGDIMKALLLGQIPAPSTVREVDPRLEAIVMKALSPEAADRHATALELRQAIDQYLAEKFPKVTAADVRELMTSVFAEQQAERAQAIHLAMTAPLSEPPPSIPAGLETIVSTVATNSFVGQTKRPIVWSIVSALLTVLILAGGIIGYLGWRGSRSEPVNPSTATAAVKVPEQVQIRLSATPATASLTIDGKPVSGNPATLTVSKDDAEHEIKATLEGYEPVARSVRFASDLSLEISMTAVAAAPSASAKPAKWTNGASRPAAKPSIKETGNCDPPFYFEKGIKTYKPGCL